MIQILRRFLKMLNKNDIKEIECYELMKEITDSMYFPYAESFDQAIKKMTGK